MKIVLSGIYYPLAMLRYFEAALKRRDDVEVYTVGPDTGYWIPWKGGMTVKTKTKIPQANLSVPQSPTIPINYIESRLPFEPDLWLQIDAGFYFEGKPKSGKNYIVGTDPHVLNYDRQRLYSDRFFCMQKCYAKQGDEYLPYAFDPIWHSLEPDTEQNYDVCFIGLQYPNRVKLLNELAKRNITFFSDLGIVYDEARHLYNQAPIGVNWSSLNDLTARVFELLGMGRLAIVNKVPDLANFFEDGKDLVVFDNNLSEVVNKIQYYIENKEEAKKIAEQGNKTVQPHTWDSRIEQILEMAKIEV